MPEGIGYDGNPVMDFLNKIAGMGGETQNFRGVPLQKGQIDSIGDGEANFDTGTYDQAGLDSLTGSVLGSPADIHNNPLFEGGREFVPTDIAPNIYEASPPPRRGIQAEPLPANKGMRGSEVPQLPVPSPSGDDAYEAIPVGPSPIDAIAEAALEEPASDALGGTAGLTPRVPGMPNQQPPQRPNRRETLGRETGGLPTSPYANNETIAYRDPNGISGSLVSPDNANPLVSAILRMLSRNQPDLSNEPVEPVEPENDIMTNIRRMLMTGQ
jgi:hypothetical protein